MTIDTRTLAACANRLDILRLILSHAAGLAIVGIGVGTVSAGGLSKYIAGLLYGVPAQDPWACLIVCSLLFLVALAAAYVPAGQWVWSRSRSFVVSKRRN